jgi:hypothetical protein
MGAIGLGLTAELLASSVGVLLVTSLFGIAGGGLAGSKIAKRLCGLSDFSFHPFPRAPSLPVVPSLHATLLIPGYLCSKTDVVDVFTPSFAPYVNYQDVYALSYDEQVLLSFGMALQEFVHKQAISMVGFEAVKHTAFSTLATAMTIPFVVAKAGDLIDNPWTLVLDRAKKAGLVLADVLQERVQGKRPVSLIGYSAGALAVFECCLELHKRKCFGLVDSVILLGAPINASDTDMWKNASSVVSRRFINGYTRNDWILSFLFRMQTMNVKVAGLCKVERVKSVNSVDLTLLVNGHLGYRDKMREILDMIGAL